MTIKELLWTVALSIFVTLYVLWRVGSRLDEQAQHQRDTASLQSAASKILLTLDNAHRPDARKPAGDQTDGASRATV